ncbi:MAG: hypothetical protein KF799_16345 [Bdellovibrionales bacterium]|nr:hypothetical protein [Bdellovibrionales bacterium]
MRLVFALIFVLPVSAVALPSGFETDLTKIEAKRVQAEAQLLHLRDEYLRQKPAQAEAVGVALKNILAICGFHSEIADSSGHKPQLVARSVLPFWRRAIKILHGYEYYFTCQEVMFYALQPSPWDQTMWNSVRALMREKAASEPLDLRSRWEIPSWSAALLVIAVRPFPRHNLIPDDIAVRIEKFATSQLEKQGYFGRDGPLEWEWDDLEKLAPVWAQRTIRAAWRMVGREEADKHSAGLVSLEQVRLIREGLRLGMDLTSLPFKSVIDEEAIDVMARHRGLALALEAMRPGSILEAQPYLANKLMYPEDEITLKVGRAASCEQELTRLPLKIR